MRTPDAFLKKIRRSYRALVFKLLPPSIAHEKIRGTLNLAVPRKESSLVFEIASTTSVMKSALTLLQQGFEREGYAGKTRSGLRLTPFHLLPESLVIVARDGERVVATISIIPRSEFGVPIDSSFDVEGVLKGVSRAVEISALAVDPSYAGNHGEVLYNLMKFNYHCLVDLLGAEMELIGVNPKMVPLYEAILLFKRIPGTSRKPYDFANGAPVVPMHFDLRSAYEQFTAVYGKKPPHLNMMDFFLLEPPPHFKLPKKSELETLLPQRRPEGLREILSWEPDLVTKLSPEQRATLIRHYDSRPECAQILQEGGAHGIVA